MANRNTRRKSDEARKAIVSAHKNGQKVTNPESKRTTPWRGGVQKKGRNDR